MIDEDELQRRELSRLLSTATDEDRKEVIRKAMSALDGHEKSFTKPDKFNVHALNPSVHASVFLGQTMPYMESMSSARLRPVSARRRPSVPNLLDAIPEVMRDANRNLASKEEEMVLPYDDIAEVISSCNDVRFKAKNIFRHTIIGSNAGIGSPMHPTGALSSLKADRDFSLSNGSLNLSHSNSNSHIISSSPKSSTTSFPHRRSPFNARKERERSGCWISTGLVPHFLIITFYEKWMIRKVEVKGFAIEKMSVHINFSAASTYSSAKLLPMTRSVSDENKFIIDLTNRSTATTAGDGKQGEDQEGVSGIGITIVIQKVSNLFCLITQVKIFTSPNS